MAIAMRRLMICRYTLALMRVALLAVALGAALGPGTATAQLVGQCWPTTPTPPPQGCGPLGTNTYDGVVCTQFFGPMGFGYCQSGMCCTSGTSNSNQTPEMSDYLAVAFVLAAAVLVLFYRRRNIAA